MDTDQLLRKAMILLNRQKTGPAKALCRKVLKQSPDNFNAQHLLGVLALKEHDYALADKALQVATQLQAPGKYLAQAWNNLALTRIYDQRLDDAWEAAGRAIAQDGEQPSFWLNRALISETRHHWKQAEEDCREALSRDPQNAESVTRLAVTLRLQDKLDAAAALIAGNQDLLLNSSHDDALGEWALISCLSGNHQRVTELCRLLTAQRHSNIATALADYAAEESALQATLRNAALWLYRLAASVDPENAALQHMLLALQGGNSPQAPHAYVQALYDKHATQFEPRLIHQLHYHAPELITSRLSRLSRDGFGAVLDLGCGTGLVGHALRQRVQLRQLTGVDLSSKMLQQAQRKQCYDRLVQAALQDYLGAEERADQALIIAADVLIYLGELDDLFAALSRRLALNGLLAVTVELGKRPYQLRPSGRYQHSEAYLRRLLADNRLSPVTVEHFPLREEHQRAIDGLLVIARKQP